MPAVVACPTPIFQFLDNTGKPAVGGSVLTQVGGVNYPTYQDSAGTIPLPNPIPLNSRGEVSNAAGASCQLFIVENVVYTFGLYDADNNLLNQSSHVSGTGLTGVDIAGLLSPITDTAILNSLRRTPAEITANVTPSNYSYPEGDGFRYGVTGLGIDDDRAAIMRAIAVFNAGGPPPRIRGICKVLKDGANPYALLFDGDAVLHGGGQLTIIGDGVNNYNLIKIIGGTDIKIDLSGFVLDCNKSSPNRLADNEDVCLRIESSVDTVYINDLDLNNYNNDGIYWRATVTGAGGVIQDCRANNGARSLVTIVKGRNLNVVNCTAKDIQLIPFNIQPTDINTELRDVWVIDCMTIDGGTDTNSTSDRAAYFISGVFGAATTLQRNTGAINCKSIGFGASYAGPALAFGIETRDGADIIVDGHHSIGCKHAGLYSYRTTKAVFQNCHSIGNDKGLWMNSCTDYSEMDNTCLGNTTYDYDYHGPDGASTFVRTDGLNQLIARGSVSYTAGTPALIAGDQFNCTSVTDLGTGDAQINLTRAAGTSNYTVNATFRSHSGTQGMIESATKTTTTFRVVTFSAGAASDQNFDFEVRGAFDKVNLPP